MTAGQPQGLIAAEHRMQLLMVQRLDGGHLTSMAEALLGRALPRVLRRWAGVYCERVDTGHVALRQQVADGVVLVTGPGGRGMTCSPAIAEATAEELEL